MSTVYAGRYPELYDLFYRDKPYDEEAEFVHACLARHGVAPNGRVLELACGTGEHALRLAARGYAVTATDNSPGMIAIAQEKARGCGADIVFAQRDMRQLPVPDVPFDAALCLFDSIGYVQTLQAVGAVFDGVRASLRPDGLFIVEFWHAPAMLHGFEAVRVRRFPDGDGTILRIAETEVDRARSLAAVTYTIYELRGDGTYRQSSECHRCRFFTLDEMNAVARTHGFTLLAAYDGFRQGAAVSDATWHVVALWKRD